MLLTKFSYIPILALKPAEMAALEELPSKDKSLLLPLISLKKWANSKTFIKSLERIKKAIGDNYFIADLDKDFLVNLAEGKVTCSDEFTNEILNLSSPDDGYSNWSDFIAQHNNFIPALQFGKVSELSAQLEKLLLLNKPIVARFEFFGTHAISLSDFTAAIKILSKKNYSHGLLVIFDYGDVNRFDLLEYQKYSNLIKNINTLLPSAVFSVSGTSFPYSFAGSYRGEIPIYERQIFNKIFKDCKSIKTIYSDRASTRALNNDGGAGTPPPRIDYPLKNEWRFIRKEFSSGTIEKEELYKLAACEMLDSEYWDHNLHLWGTQMIEKTCLGDPFGITSANRATAVRINLHLYQQLHYHDSLDDLDTEEEWVD
ncbi:beta family protein [Enterobacter mori]|uniref:beta family protein n=1 Tax=Enterobacter mori TaxID=539813 RepID=UPI00397B5003